MDWTVFSLHVKYQRQWISGICNEQFKSQQTLQFKSEVCGWFVFHASFNLLHSWKMVSFSLKI